MPIFNARKPFGTLALFGRKHLNRIIRHGEIRAPYVHRMFGEARFQRPQSPFT